MAVNKSKKNIKESSLRTPKAKNKLGLVVPRIGLPHDEFVKADSEKRAEIDFALGMTSQSGQPEPSASGSLSGETDMAGVTSATGQAGRDAATKFDAPPTLTGQTVTTSQTDSAVEPEPIEHVTLDESAIIPDLPTANGESTHTALTAQPTLPTLPSPTIHTATSGVVYPANRTSPQFPYDLPQPIAPLFRGKSKQLYDALYGLTLGAETPQRAVRIRKGELMKLAGIGSRNTFIANIDHLVNAGLLRQTVIAGEADGNEFELLDPPNQTAQPGLTSTTARTTSTTEASAVQPLIDTLDAASRELTGSALTSGDLAALKSIAELIINAAAQHPEVGQTNHGIVELAIRQLTSSE